MCRVFWWKVFYDEIFLNYIMPVQYETVKVSLGRTHKSKLRNAVGSMSPVTLKLSNKHLSGKEDAIVVTKTMRDRMEKKQSQGLGTTLRFTRALLKANQAQSGGWLQTALTIVPLAQEALKDDSTSKLLERLERLRGSGVDDDAWKTFTDSFKFAFTNPTDALELLGREAKNLFTGNLKANERRYRLPPGVDFKKGMDYKKIGTEIKGSGITFF
jgi:hypothetical protein